MLLAVAFATPNATFAASPEVRGIWLTATSPDHIRTGANTASVMADLRGVGLNTVYVETWKNGYTNFPSPTLAAFSLQAALQRSDLREDTAAVWGRPGAPG